MTIKELYLYAKEKGMEDYEVKIQYSDEGGYYSGTRDLLESELNIEDKVIII